MLRRRNARSSIRSAAAGAGLGVAYGGYLAGRSVYRNARGLGAAGVGAAAAYAASGKRLKVSSGSTGGLFIPSRGTTVKKVIFKRKGRRRSARKGMNKFKFRSMVYDVMNPSKQWTQEIIYSTAIPVNTKSYIDCSATSTTAQHYLGSPYQIYTDLSGLHSSVGATLWPAQAVTNEYNIKKYTMYYEITNLSNAPIFIRPVKWVANTDTWLESAKGILGYMDEIYLNSANFPNEGLAATALMTSVNANQFTSNEVLTSVFEQPAFKSYVRKHFTIKRGAEVCVPPQGQLKLYDRMAKGSKHFRMYDYQGRITAAALDYARFAKGMTKGFIIEVVGETARGGTAGVAAAAHAVALPSYISIHRKIVFNAQIGRDMTMINANYDINSTPALNATPVVFGSENNAAVPGV